MRGRLLSEHLAVTPDELDTALADAGGACTRPSRPCTAATDARWSASTPTVPDEVDAALPDERLLDPIEPIDSDQIVAEFVSHEARPQAANRVAVFVLLVLVLGGMAFAWRCTPLREWADFRSLLTMIEHVPRHAVRAGRDD